MATGWKVNPERQMAKELRLREMLQECTSWKGIATLMAENPDKCVAKPLQLHSVHSAYRSLSVLM